MVDKRSIEFALTEQKEEIESKSDSNFCQRAEENAIELQSPQAQVVIGVRRSGKSTLCYQALRRQGVGFAYADFDDERLGGIESAQLNDVLEVLYKLYGDFKYLFLDEVQNVEGWHLFVNRLLRRGMHVIITGSNARLLSSDLATHLTGRSKEIALYPFSFKEFCAVKKVDVESQTTKAEAFRRAAFDEYMQQGGFPELMQVADSHRYVMNLVGNILQRDIEQRYSIAYKSAFEKLAHHLLNNAPTIVSSKDIAATFEFKSVHTVKNYIDYLKQAYLLIGVHKYSPKSRMRMTHEKLYAIDVAMMNHRENAFTGANLGYRLETIVFVHLLRRAKMDGEDVYYLRERSGECDFVVCRGNTVVQAIQVSYDISGEKTRRREINGLLLAAHTTGCRNLLLLTDHERSDITVDGLEISVRPVYEWSLTM